MLPPAPTARFASKRKHTHTHTHIHRERERSTKTQVQKHTHALTCTHAHMQACLITSPSRLRASVCETLCCTGSSRVPLIPPAKARRSSHRTHHSHGARHDCSGAHCKAARRWAGRRAAARAKGWRVRSDLARCLHHRHRFYRLCLFQPRREGRTRCKSVPQGLWSSQHTPPSWKPRSVDPGTAAQV